MKLFLRFFSIFGITLCITVPALFTSAQPNHSVKEKLQQANIHYSKGSYDEAIIEYRAIIAESGLSAEILHNLANSYAATNRYGLAILNYLRGLRLSPGDSDLRGDLELTRKNMGMFEEEKSTKEKIFDVFDLNQWAILALSTYLILTVILLVNLRFPIKRGLKTICFMLGISISVCCMGIFHQHLFWNGAVIISPDTRLLISPFESSSSLGIIQEGSIIYSEKKHGEYEYIHDKKGRAGWIPSSTFETINTSYKKYSLEDTAQ